MYVMCTCVTDDSDIGCRWTTGSQTVACHRNSEQEWQKDARADSYMAGIVNNR